MTALPNLEGLPWLPYLDEGGQIPEELESKAGVYAIFDREQNLAYVGISRDIATSLKQHLVRVPDRCYWCKAWLSENLDRNLLTEIQQAWQGDLPIDRKLWEKPIDCRELMTDQEREKLKQATEEKQINRILKDLARRVEEQIIQKLTDRGVSFAIRFNPKRKEEGLLDLKLW